VTPLLLVLLGVALYFMGALIVLAPKAVPMMLAIQATMFGPLLCALLLAAWFVLQPLAAALFGRRPQKPAAVPEAVTAGVEAEHAGSTSVKAPGPVMAAAPDRLSLDADVPPQPDGGRWIPALLTAVKRFGIVMLVAVFCVACVAVAAGGTTRF